MAPGVPRSPHDARLCSRGTRTGVPGHPLPSELLLPTPGKTPKGLPRVRGYHTAANQGLCSSVKPLESGLPPAANGAPLLSHLVNTTPKVLAVERLCLKAVPERASVGEQARKGTQESHSCIWEGKDPTTLRTDFTRSSVGQSYGSPSLPYNTSAPQPRGRMRAEVYHQQR